MKKVLRETQTLSAGCSEAQPKFFAPPQTPFPEAWDGQNLISWRWSLPLPTDPVWWGSMHAISSYRGNRPTQTWAARPLQTRPQTGPITVHYAAKHVQCYKPLIVRLIDWSMDGWMDGLMVQVDEQYLLLGTYNGELKFYNVQTAEEYMSSTCHMSMMTNCQPSQVSKLFISIINQP